MMVLKGIRDLFFCFCFFNFGNVEDRYCFYDYYYFFFVFSLRQEIETVLLVTPNLKRVKAFTFEYLNKKHILYFKKLLYLFYHIIL